VERQAVQGRSGARGSHARVQLLLNVQAVLSWNRYGLCGSDHGGHPGSDESPRRAPGQRSDRSCIVSAATESPDHERHRPPEASLLARLAGYDVRRGGERTRYTRAIADAGTRVGVDIAQEGQPLEDNAAVAAFVKKVQDEKPDAVFVTLQHLDSWDTPVEIAKAGVPTIVFAPVGTAFTQHVRRLAFQPGAHVISSLEMPAIEQALRMVAPGASSRPRGCSS